jgi:hypothetical protein
MSVTFQILQLQLGRFHQNTNTATKLHVPEAKKTQFSLQ